MLTASGSHASTPKTSEISAITKASEIEHPLFAATKYCDSIELLQHASELANSVMKTFTAAHLVPNSQAYGLAVAVLAVVATTASSSPLFSPPGSLSTESFNTAPLAVAALATLVAADKMNVRLKKAVTKSIPSTNSRFQDFSARRVRGAQMPTTEPLTHGNAPQKRPAGSVLVNPQPFKQARTSAATIVHSPAPETKVASKHSLATSNLADLIESYTRIPISAQISTTPFITTFIAESLANAIKSTFTVNSTESAGPATETPCSIIYTASFAFIHGLAAVAKSSLSTTSVPASSIEPATAAASASAAIPQDPDDSAIQTIIGLTLPEPSDAGLIDRLTVYLAKAAAVTLRSAQAPSQSAGAGVTRPVGFLLPQAEAAAAVSATLPHLASGPASLAPGDDAEITADDNDDKSKP